MGNSCFKSAELRPRIEWVVGLDFGTTYSGFAYARAFSEEPEIHVNYAWPQKETERPYAKTLTALFYKREGPDRPAVCTSWGYCARTDFFNRNKKTHDPRGMYLTTFKLLLMQDDISLPPPLTVESLITDYLKLIGEQALSVIENHDGSVSFSRDAVQWCVTVPSIWDAKAKHKMKEYMVNAGLVSEEAGGINAVKVALEPEAASFHCHQILHKEQRKLCLHDKLLVVDVGGGTVDIVVQEFVGSSDSFKVKELTKSSGGFCGGTFVDQSFMTFVSSKIGCLDAFLKDFPSFKTRLLKDWEEIKCAFGNELMDSDNVSIRLHYKLAPRWEAYEQERGNLLHDSSEVELTKQDLQTIFDPMVEKILELIGAQMKQVPDIKVMFVVGGFASSPYLMRRIRARFGEEVTHIVSPPDPGTAVAHGAVSLALHPDAIVSNFKQDELV